MELVAASIVGVEAIVRPPRRVYNIDSIPTSYITKDGDFYKRYPVNIRNKHHQNIVGSLYTDAKKDIRTGGPCVIYLHGNASCQFEGFFLVPNLCHHGINVFLFDFCGCGNSDGDFISLGLQESEDLSFILYKLQETFNLGPFILWGRSMGAVTALMNKYESVIGLIIDSTFSSLPNLIKSIVKQMLKFTIFAKPLTWLLYCLVKDVSNFSIYDISPIERIKTLEMPPALFGHGKKDTFIDISHCYDTFNAYPNPMKKMIEEQLGHNSRRSYNWFNNCFNFIFKLFGISMDNFQIRQIKSNPNFLHFKNAEDLIMHKAKNVSIDSEFENPESIDKEDEEPYMLAYDDFPMNDHDLSDEE